MLTKLNQVNVISSDLAATVAFYRSLGVEMKNPSRTAGGHGFHVSNRGEQSLIEANLAAFAKAWNEAWADEPELVGRVVIGLRVDKREDVDRLYAQATAAGHRGLKPPHDAFWGARYALLQDPDGVAVGLMSSRDGSHAPPPPGFE